jgi:hypothetical protein
VNGQVPSLQVQCAVFGSAATRRANKWTREAQRPKR